VNVYVTSRSIASTKDLKMGLSLIIPPGERYEWVRGNIGMTDRA